MMVDDGEYGQSIFAVPDDECTSSAVSLAIHLPSAPTRPHIIVGDEHSPGWIMS